MMTPPLFAQNSQCPGYHPAQPTFDFCGDSVSF
jgi:hypothetical protein